MPRLLRAIRRLGAELWELFFRGPELLRREGPGKLPLGRNEWERSSGFGRMSEIR